MRNLIVPVILGLVAACSPTNSSTSLVERTLNLGQPQAKPMLQVVRFVEQVNNGAPRIKGTLESIAIPSLAVLDVKRNGIETWLAEGGESFALQKGVLLNTRGFGNDLMSSDASQTISAVLALRPQDVTRQMAHIGAENQTVKRQFDCEVVVDSDIDLEIDATTYATTVMNESCAGGATTFENTYWVRKNDHVIIQSRQWISEEVGYLIMRDQPLQ